MISLDIYIMPECIQTQSLSADAASAASALPQYLVYSERNLQNFTNSCNKFDRLCIDTSSEYVTILDEAKFDYTVSSTNQTETYLYKQTVPFYLRISVNDRSAKIEFTGKALLDDYPSLISHTNIATCFRNINALGICRIDTEAVMQDSDVYSCDVTCDKKTDKQLTALKSYFIIKNNRKWSVAESADYILKFKNTHLGKRKKTPLVIYDKYHEIQMSDNRKFLEAVTDAPKMIESFKGTMRYELNLKSVDRMRYYLKIHDTSLTSVLHSTNDSIGQALYEIFEPAPL